MHRFSRSPIIGQAAVSMGLVLALGCSDAAAPVAPVAASLQATTSLSQSATVGTSVAVAPAVRVVTSGGAPVSGVSVSFMTESGGGTVALASATSGADGIASAGSWTLGTTAGNQTVRAAANGLAPVTFSATALAGPAAQIAPSTGSGQTALTGAAVAVKPAVVVRDAFGNAVQGASVRFDVASGGGTVTGASASTDLTGIATVGGWTLGIVPGVQTLIARLGNGSISTTLSATAALPSGCIAAPYAIGATIPGTWATDDCKSPGARGIFDPANALYDQYDLVLTAQTQFRATVTGPVDRSLRIRRKTSGEIVAQMGSTPFNPSNATTTLEMKYALAAGAYVIEVQSPTAGATGPYSLSTALDNTATCTPIIFGTYDITLSDSVSPTTDCFFLGGYEDRLVMVLPTGLSLRFTLSSTEMAPFLVFRDDRQAAASPTLQTARATAPGTVTFDWTTTFSGYYEVIMTTLEAAKGQKYTLKIERLP
ncbi:MAG: hypothetical protein V4550_00945 [Gemmatimonadota bacterium]